MSSRHTPAARARLQAHRDLVAAQARDRAETVAELLARPDLSRRDVADRLHLSKRTVERIIARKGPAVTSISPRKSSLGWMDLAACRTEDPELFFGPPGETSRIEEAKAVCARCEVRGPCLSYGCEKDFPDAVMGGLTEDERRAHGQVAA